MLRLKDGRKLVCSLDFSPDSRLLAATPIFASQGIKIFDLTKPKAKPVTLKPPIYTGPGTPEGVTCAYFTTDQKIVYPRRIIRSGQDDISIKLVESTDGSVISHIWLDSEQIYQSLIIDIQRKSVIYWTLSGIYSWALDNPESIVPILYFGRQFQTVNVSRNLKWYVTTNRDETLTAYNIADPSRIVKFEDSFYFRLAFSNSGDYLAINSFLKAIEVYDMRETNPSKMRLDFDDKVTAIQFAPDGRNLLVACDNLIHVIDIQTGAEKTCFDFKIQTILALKISDDGTMFAVSDKTGTIIVVDIDF